MEVDVLEGYGLPRAYIDLLKSRGFEEFNPVQAEALARGYLNGRNIVVAAPTGSGKTLIGEIALAKAALSGNIGVYLTPLRALASEKVEELRALEDLSLRIDITTGDYDKPAEELGSSDIVIATYERFDSLLRLKPSWIGRVKTVVIDESHLISDPERGPIIEMIVARLLRGGAQLILLSATIGNPEALSSWIGGELVVSNWRPVKLVEGFYDKHKDAVIFPEQRVEAVEEIAGDRILDPVLTSASKLGYQTLVFLHNRKKVEEYAQKASQLINAQNNSQALKEALSILEESPSSLERRTLSELMKRGVAYHHAGLSFPARGAVEEAFRGRSLKLLFATPTLAAGVNLPARRVYVSIKRYDPSLGRRANISVSEYKQMAGRAGRPRYDAIGEAVILDASSAKEGLSYINGTPEDVGGKTLVSRALRIHALSLIASGDANTLEEIANMFSCTLSGIAYSDDAALRHKILETLDELEEMKMVHRANGRFRATSIGIVTSRMYLDPYTVNLYHRLRGQASPGDLFYLHAITLTPDYRRGMPYISERVLEDFEELADAIYERGDVPPPYSSLYSYDEWLESLLHALALFDWISEKSEDEISKKYTIGPGDLYNMRETATWIAYSLSYLEAMLGNIEHARRLRTLSLRLEKGVKEDAIELASLKYIGRVRARVLIRNGIRTLRDLANTPPSKIAGLPTFGPKIVEEIYEQLRQMGILERNK